MVDLLQHLNQTHQEAQEQRISVTRVTADACDYESPQHEHAQGQLVLALAGGVRCAIQGQVWMVPPQGAVWIPPHQTHTNYVTHNAEVCIAFIATAAGLPEVPVGTIAVSPLLRRIVIAVGRLTGRFCCYMATPMTPMQQAEDVYQQRLVDLLLLELARAQPQAYAIPVLHHPRLQTLYQHLLAEPQTASATVHGPKAFGDERAHLIALG